jgi:hypothetical protein
LGRYAAKRLAGNKSVNKGDVIGHSRLAADTSVPVKAHPVIYPVGRQEEATCYHLDE